MPRLAPSLRLAAAGRSGIGRVLLGSVAERVFGKATAPVMLVRPTGVAAT
jgi:nucleotide-binding universal stress UspA family protein